MADYSLITPRLAVGGSIGTRENLEALRRAGFTHIINTQIEFDDRALLSPGEASPAIFDARADDDFQPKPAEFFRGAVRFALDALSRPDSKVLVHCGAGIHRAPLIALAILRALGYGRHDARRLLHARRPQADFPQVYLDSLEAFLAEWEEEQQAK